VDYLVILIGGNSQTGKTFMAQNLLEKYKVPYLSVDHLKMGIFNFAVRQAPFRLLTQQTE